MQKESLSPRVLPNGAQSISILCRVVYFYDCLGTIVRQKGSLSPRVLPNGTQLISILCRIVYFYDCLGTIGGYPGIHRPLSASTVHANHPNDTCVLNGRLPEVVYGAHDRPSITVIFPRCNMTQVLAQGICGNVSTSGWTYTLRTVLANARHQD